MKPVYYQSSALYNQELQQELQLFGYELTKEDYQYLYHSQQQACRTYQMVEFESVSFRLLIQTFLKSPYLTQTRLLPLLHDAIYTYYAIQRTIPHHTYDDTLIQHLYDAYLWNHGVFDKRLLSQVKHLLKEDTQ